MTTPSHLAPSRDESVVVESEAPATTGGWARLRTLILRRRLLISLLMVTSIASALVESAVLALIAEVAATLASGATRVHIVFGGASLRALLTVAVALALIRLLLQFPSAYLPARMSSDVQEELRKELFGAFTRTSWGAQSADLEGHFQELLMRQVEMAALGVQRAVALIIAVLSCAVVMASAFTLNAVAALIVLAAAVALFFALRPLHQLGRRNGQEWSRASMELAGGVGEAVRVAQETAAFGVGGPQRARAARLIEAVQGPFFRVQLLTGLVPGLYQSALYLVVVLGLAALHASGTAHVASLGAVILLLVRAAGYGQQAQAFYQMLIQSLPYLERVGQARADYESAFPAVGSLPLNDVHSIAFDGVAFAYGHGRPVLTDVMFEVRAGETVGIVGPSGAGKSSLVQILLGLRSPSGGRFLVNGMPAEAFVRSDWHKLFAFVPQDPQLIHATVAENIRFFRDIGDVDVERAARLAGIHEDIVGWVNGYDTIIGPRADALSGGQEQRVCLARALAARPAVLVLDEPTSALDPHSEAVIQRSLASLKRELTVFVVAHRMSTVDICDRLMVIVDGRLEAFAPTASLLEQSPYYRSVAAPVALGSPEIGE